MTFNHEKIVWKEALLTLSVVQPSESFMKIDIKSMLTSPLGNLVGLKWKDALGLFDAKNPEYYINRELDFGLAAMNDHLVIYGYEDGLVHTFSSRRFYDRSITKRSFLKTFKLLYDGYTTPPTKDEFINHPGAKLVEKDGSESYISIDLKEGRSFGVSFYENELIRIGAVDHNLM